MNETKLLKLLKGYNKTSGSSAATNFGVNLHYLFYSEHVHVTAAMNDTISNAPFKNKQNQRHRQTKKGNNTAFKTTIK